MILTIIGISCVSVLFQASEPMILLKRYMGLKEEEYMTYSKWKKTIHKLLYCCLCSGFWIGLILTQNILAASIISITGELIYKKIKD
jgi:hypothetical protein